MGSTTNNQRFYVIIYIKAWGRCSSNSIFTWIFYFIFSYYFNRPHTSIPHQRMHIIASLQFNMHCCVGITFFVYNVDTLGEGLVFEVAIDDVLDNLYGGG